MMKLSKKQMDSVREYKDLGLDDISVKYGIVFDNLIDEIVSQATARGLSRKEATLFAFHTTFVIQLARLHDLDVSISKENFIKTADAIFDFKVFEVTIDEILGSNKPS